MKEIALTQGKIAVVDDADYERAMQWKWCAHYDKERDRWYATRKANRSEALTEKTVWMHRFLMDAPRHIQVDHRDGNGLNNSRSTNLRLATHQQNQYNRGPAKTNTSGHKGVSWHKSANKWRATIRINGRQKHLGLFTEKEAAAKVYAEVAAELHGEFARVQQERA